jgi:hypothetical protein
MSFECTIVARRHDAPRNRAWQDRTPSSELNLLALVIHRREGDRRINRIAHMRDHCIRGRPSIFKLVCGGAPSTAALENDHHCRYIAVDEFRVRRDLCDLPPAKPAACHVRFNVCVTRSCLEPKRCATSHMCTYDTRALNSYRRRGTGKPSSDGDQPLDRSPPPAMWSCMTILSRRVESPFRMCDSKVIRRAPSTFQTPQRPAHFLGTFIDKMATWDWPAQRAYSGPAATGPQSKRVS